MFINLFSNRSVLKKLLVGVTCSVLPRQTHMLRESRVFIILNTTLNLHILSILSEASLKMRSISNQSRWLLELLMIKTNSLRSRAILKDWLMLSICQHLLYCDHTCIIICQTHI